MVDFLDRFDGGGATDTQGQVMAKAVNAALRTVCLDALAPSPPPDAAATWDWVNESVDVTTMLGDELPAGPDEAPVPEADIAAVRSLLDDLAARIGLANVRGERRVAAAG